MRKLLTALVLAAALFASAAIPLAGAQGKAMTTTCDNRGGNQPAGQQGKCQGEGLTETTRNPAGHAPPGQQ